MTAFREIEKANPDTLYGIFGNASWTNKDKLPDRKLADLIEHFSTKTAVQRGRAPRTCSATPTSTSSSASPTSRTRRPASTTPRARWSDCWSTSSTRRRARRVYDPACGTGGMLIEVIEHVKAAGGSPKTLWGKLFGQEKVLATSAIARMNLLLHGVEDFKIVRERHPPRPGVLRPATTSRSSTA